MMELLTERVERLLALLLLHTVKGESQRAKVLMLSRAGFSNVEIADLLQTSSQTVRQLMYESRRAASTRGGRKRK